MLAFAEVMSRSGYTDNDGEAEQAQAETKKESSGCRVLVVLELSWDLGDVVGGAGISGLGLELALETQELWDLDGVELWDLGSLWLNLGAGGIGSEDLLGLTNGRNGAAEICMVSIAILKRN